MSNIEGTEVLDDGEPPSPGEYEKLVTHFAFQELTTRVDETFNQYDSTSTHTLESVRRDEIEVGEITLIRAQFPVNDDDGVSITSYVIRTPVSEYSWLKGRDVLYQSDDEGEIVSPRYLSHMLLRSVLPLGEERREQDRFDTMSRPSRFLARVAFAIQAKKGRKSLPTVR